jgi:hypothetical protein
LCARYVTLVARGWRRKPLGCWPDAAHALLPLPTTPTSRLARRTTAPHSQSRPLVAHCRLGLGKLYRRTDKREQAREHLTTATTMYREMGMTYWLEKAEPETRELT